MDNYFLARYAGAPATVFGFHGCSAEIAHKVICDGDEIRDSENDYDWLGSGKYFWEANPLRALQWAYDKYNGTDIEPAVIGACIDMSHCLNLLDSSGLSLLRKAYHRLKAAQIYNKINLPENSKCKNGTTLLRRLDCLVVNYARNLQKQKHNTPAFTTVRGVFWEGKELYPGAEMREKNHIQICVRDPKAVLCYFKPRYFNISELLKEMDSKN